MDRHLFPLDAYPLVVAHRGSSSSHPENTLEAFAAALEAGAQAVETDVRLSSDGVPVVFHDAEVSRTTDGVGYVHELTLAELRSLDASVGRGERSRVPTLREVLDLLSGRAGIDLEIKNIPGEPAYDTPMESIVEATIRELDAAAFTGGVLISSFNLASIERSRELAPWVPTGVLSLAAVPPMAVLEYATDHGHGWILPSVEALAPVAEELISTAHTLGVQVGTWTVDDPQEAERLFRLGLDAIASNDPTVALAARARALTESG
jgi:glycerophosphoryl diester phosphodiesterase